MAHREIRKRVPIDLTMHQWRELLADFPGVPMSRVLLQIHLRGRQALAADQASDPPGEAKESL